LDRRWAARPTLGRSTDAGPLDRRWAARPTLGRSTDAGPLDRRWAARPTLRRRPTAGRRADPVREVDPALRAGTPEGAGPAAVVPPGPEHQVRFSAVSSTTNDVCSETSSAPVKEIVTVCPANDDRLKDFWLYPEPLFRFEYVARVVPPALTVSLSYCVV